MSEIKDKVRGEIALCKLCNDYGMTEDAMKLCIEQDKIRQNHIDDAYKFASKLLSIPELAIVDRDAELPKIDPHRLSDSAFDYGLAQEDMVNAGYVLEVKDARKDV